MHRRVERSHFQIHLHRTEITKRPHSAPYPIFPLKKKYYHCNYTLEGIENRANGRDERPLDTEGAIAPVLTEEEA